MVLYLLSLPLYFFFSWSSNCLFSLSESADTLNTVDWNFSFFSLTSLLTGWRDTPTTFTRGKMLLSRLNCLKDVIKCFTLSLSVSSGSVFLSAALQFYHSHLGRFQSQLTRENPAFNLPSPTQTTRHKTSNKRCNV